MMGTIIDSEWTVKPETLKENEFLATDVPSSFDGRTAWPECASVIGHIRD
jgi:hypothetical protein